MNKISPRVGHLTAVSLRRDTRIFEKLLRSLAEAGLDEHVVVTHGQG